MRIRDMLIRLLAVVALLLLTAAAGVRAARADNEANGAVLAAAASYDGAELEVRVVGRGFVWGSHPTIQFAESGGAVIGARTLDLQHQRRDSLGAFSFVQILRLANPCARSLVVSVDGITDGSLPYIGVAIPDPAFAAGAAAGRAATHLAAIEAATHDPAQIEPAYRGFVAAYDAYSAAVAQDVACGYAPGA